MNILLPVLFLMIGQGYTSGINPVTGVDSVTGPDAAACPGSICDPAHFPILDHTPGPDICSSSVSTFPNTAGAIRAYASPANSIPAYASPAYANPPNSILTDANIKPVFMASARLSYPPDSSSHKPVAPPADKSTSISAIYMDELDLISDTSGFFVKIEGNLPTPCHNISLPAYVRTKDTLSISITSWNRTDLMCTQVLEPFLLYLDITAFLTTPSDDGSVPLPDIQVNGHPVTPRITE